MNNLFYQIPEISNTLFGSNVKLLPSVDELFELELANLEYHILDKDELIERSAFPKSVNRKLGRSFPIFLNLSTRLSFVKEILFYANDW